MDSFFFRKHITLLMTRKSGVMSLMTIYIFLLEKLTNSCGVAMGYVRSKSFVLANQTADKNGCLFLIEAIVDDAKFVLINIYNSNTESQHGDIILNRSNNS